jgi:large subunit ribosomal protein L30
MKEVGSSLLEIKLVRSLAGMKESHIRVIKSLGLRKLGAVKTVKAVNPILGQVNKVIQYLEVNEVREAGRG